MFKIGKFVITTINEYNTTISQLADDVSAQDYKFYSAMLKPVISDIKRIAKNNEAKDKLNYAVAYLQDIIKTGGVKINEHK